MTELQIEVAKQQNILVVRLEGELDFTNTSEVEDRITEALDNDLLGVVVDLAGVRYIDSAGVRTMFDLVARVEACRQGICLILDKESPVRRLVQITSLDSVTTVFGCLDDCVAHLRDGAEDRI